MASGARRRTDRRELAAGDKGFSDGEAELGVGAGPFAPHGCQDADIGVNVVMDLDGGLAGMVAQDSAAVLDHAAFERHRVGQEQGVQLRAVVYLVSRNSVSFIRGLFSFSRTRLTCRNAVYTRKDRSITRH